MSWTNHPSIERPIRWGIVGNAIELGGSIFGPHVVPATAMDSQGGDAVVLDWMAASYLAPGIKPRPHAVVVRAREQRAGQPALIVVTASYSPDPSRRPSGVAMARSEGTLVGDAIVVARSLGVKLDTVLIELALFERMARNEHLDVETLCREFLGAAMASLKSTLGPTSRAEM